MDMKRFFLYAIAIAALALAGCGGGGGGTAMMDDMDGDGGMMTTTPTCEGDQVLNADSTACVDPTPTGPTDEEIAAAATAAAATKLTAMRAEQAELAVNGIGGTPPTGEDTTYGLSITRDRDATKVTISDSNADFAEDDDPKFETVMDLGEANGFAGTMNRRINSDKDGEKVEEVVVVRTDISAPKATEFGEVDGQRLNVDLEPDADADGDGNDANDFTALRVISGTGDVNLANIMATDFAAGSGSTVTHSFLPAADDGDMETSGNQPRDAAEVMGYYNGAMGTYTCNDAGATACTVTVNAKGEVTGISTNWIFTPATGETSDVVDADYLAYGIWLKRTTKDGETTYDEVESFTMASEISPTVIGQIEDVEGSATYTGNSTGVYVKNVTDNTGAITSSTSGLYSALVNLTANFGGNNIGTNNQFAIEGEVTDFELEKGEANDWAVKLGLVDFSGRTGMGPGKEAAGTSFANTFNGVATGDSTATEGSWQGTFYGVSGDVDHDDDPDTDTVNTAPSAVLGELNAYFTDGAVLGGFGANKE